MNTSPFKLFIGLLVLLASASCQKEAEPTDHNPVVRKPIYSKSIPVSELNEISCDSVPDYFEPPYRLEYAESGWISNIAQNPNNDQQWAYSIQTQPSSSSLVGTNVIWMKDFEKGKTTQLASTGDIQDFLWGGKYVVFVEEGSTTVLCNTETKEITKIHGSHPRLSPNGKWMKINKFHGGHRDELINLDNLKVSHSWKTGEIGFGIFSNSSIYYFNYTDDHIKQIKTFDLESKKDTVLMNDIDFWGRFVCWIDDNQILTDHGTLLNPETKLTTTVPPIYARLDRDSVCETKELLPVTYMKWEERILCRKSYYEVIDTYLVKHYVRWHTLNLDGSQEERIELNF